MAKRPAKRAGAVYEAMRREEVVEREEELV